MADSLTTKIVAQVIADFTKDLELVDPASNLSVKTTIDLANGTAADQADLIFHDQRTVTASSDDDLDLAGTLTDQFGATLTFARVKLIYIKAAAANGDNLQVGGAATNQFINWVNAATDEIIIRPDGVFLLAAPDATAYAVTAGTGDLLQITNADSGASATYDIIIIGASA